MRIRIPVLLVAALLWLAPSPAPAQLPPAGGGVTSGSRGATPETVVRALFDEAWSRGRYDGLAGLLAPELTFHFRGRARPMSHDQFRGMVQMWRTAFPDLAFRIEEVVASGDHVAARFTFTGTHQGELFGIASTGRAVNVSMMAFFRLADGRVAEMWEDYDEHGMRQQLAAPAR